MAYGALRGPGRAGRLGLAGVFAVRCESPVWWLRFMILIRGSPAPGFFGRGVVTGGWEVTECGVQGVDEVAVGAVH